jgi:hypothetical protein
VDAFTIWDSYPLGYYWVGAYQTLVRQGTNYVNNATGQVQNYIESGQAFFIQSGPAGSENLAIRESDKSDGSQNVSFAPPRTGRPTVNLWARLVATPADQPAAATDGLFVDFDTEYSTNIDQLDVKKFFNPADNLSVFSGGFYLVAERTAYPQPADSIQLILSSPSQQAYSLEFTATNLRLLHLKPYLYDRYLDKFYPIDIDASTSIPFTINSDAGSKALNRFKIVFRKSPSKGSEVIITSAEQRADRTIMVTWTASGEQEIEKYEVERSADKSLFTGIISTVSEKGDGPTTYSKTDISPLPADNYYRIKSTGKDGRTIFSNVVKVAAPVKAPEVSSEGTISVSPNPVTGKTLQLRFNNEPAGRYTVQLLNSLGQVLQTNSVVIDGNGRTVSISLGASVNPGQYQIKSIGPGGKTTQQAVLVE